MDYSPHREASARNVCVCTLRCPPTTSSRHVRATKMAFSWRCPLESLRSRFHPRFSEHYRARALQLKDPAWLHELGYDGDGGARRCTYTLMLAADEQLAHFWLQWPDIETLK